MLVPTHLNELPPRGAVPLNARASSWCVVMAPRGYAPNRTVAQDVAGSNSARGANLLEYWGSVDRGFRESGATQTALSLDVSQAAGQAHNRNETLPITNGPSSTSIRF